MKTSVATPQSEEIFIEGFAREIGSNNVFGKRFFRFHTHQSDSKEIPYEGPMIPATLVLQPNE